MSSYSWSSSAEPLQQPTGIPATLDEESKATDKKFTEGPLNPQGSLSSLCLFGLLIVSIHTPTSLLPSFAQVPRKSMMFFHNGRKALRQPTHALVGEDSGGCHDIFLCMCSVLVANTLKYAETLSLSVE